MPPSDEEIRKMAKVRVEFRQHLVVYVLVNLFLVGVWYFTSRGSYWPIWVHLGWGIGVAFSAYAAYGPPAGGAVEREAAKLRERYGGS